MNGGVTIVTRSSPLALRQAREVVGLLDVKTTVLPLLSLGDKDKRTSLLDGVPDDFFTRELDEAVLAGRADAAVHSAKDLPFPLPRGLAVAALTRPLDPAEALVSKGGVPIGRLPAGAVIGVSSQRRRQAIAALRPDVVPRSIRGTIEERIAQVRRGDFDAAVVAACALKRLNLEREITEILPFPAHPLQGMLAVTVREDRADLRALFAPLDFRRTFGTVVIAGAGPGDPGMMTRKAARACAAADVIIYDDLIHPDIIRPLRAEKIYAGKRKGRFAYSQAELNELLHQYARRGKNVLRLKGGDPLLFARTGEEIGFLSERHIPVAIIPGVSAASAGATAAGIPLSRRGRGRSVAFASAHHATDDEIRIPDADTLVFFMAASRLPVLARALLASGRDPLTPVSLVRAAGWPDELTLPTTLGEMADKSLASPLVVIVGTVAAEVPQRGCLLYTGLSVPAFLRAAGERIVHYPLIRVKKLDYHLTSPLSRYEALIFTSQTAVRFFSGLNGAEQIPVYAIGPATAAALRRRGITNIVIPEEAHSEALAALLRPSDVGPALYPCSANSHNLVHNLPGVERLNVYKTIPRSQEIRDLREVTSVFFTSPSTVESFFRLYRSMPGHILCRAQGPLTARSLEGAGVSGERIINVSEIQAKTG